jgi:hypothetical protein
MALRNKKPRLADQKMCDFCEGPYLMSDGHVYVFVKTDPGEDLLPESYYWEGEKEFAAKVEEIATILGVSPRTIYSKKDGWKNVWTIYYDEYDQEGNFVDNGPEYLYYDFETVRNYCQRNLYALPVKYLGDDPKWSGL